MLCPKDQKRVITQHTPYYSPGVLIGNWVEDTFECPKDPCITLYCAPKEEIDYEKMKPQRRINDFRDNKAYGQDGSVPLVWLQDSHRGCNNFLTTNDLVYNHLPKPLCGPDMRYYRRCKHIFYPQPDNMQCYPYTTEWGLRFNKKLEWQCTDVSDYISSVYDISYVPPKLNQYLPAACRHARNSTFTKEFRFKMTKPVEPRQKVEKLLLPPPKIKTVEPKKKRPPCKTYYIRC